MLFFAAILVFGGCATPNSVTQIQGQGTVTIKEKTGTTSRFANLYKERQKYPETCESDCYPDTDALNCINQSKFEDCQYVAQQTVPAQKSGFSVTWLGHASFYVTTDDGTSVLIDPVSEQFDWPVDWAFRLDSGFYRKEPGWLSSTQLEELDGVLYSHIHYDHFSKADIKKLGTTPGYFTPLNFASHFPEQGYRITEMAWFSETKLGNTKLHFVPAHHFSSRIWVPYLYEDNDKTLWGGWILEHNGKRLFYAGDTGYSAHFKDIHTRYGSMDVCLMPIASYYRPDNGDWYRYVHTTPEDALTAAEDLKCKVMVPWGYGNNSWKMGDHSSHSALVRLLHMHKKMEATIPLVVLNEGDMLDL
ncbi:MBL fold metallo-hydrolase [Alteromonas sp. ASW11-19]|uniref:MBL fold metallo-hydrolase n=1 Tax=Alteromonas salexigens TaxID=2982530 RepID=A0ABT2VMS4_9ALTE|nr:MBL fold metallo-hydrolase [Alteromonas salexigens]MCU7554400.1 MBL fold metallo-hydrolase [Alteromonas salexigens]